MKQSTKILILVLAVIEVAFAILMFNLLGGIASLPGIVKYLLIGMIVLLSLAADYGIMHAGSAAVVSDAKKLKDADDYIKAFEAWLREDTPFAEQIKQAITQLQSLKRKQAALRAVLDDSKDSPFLSTAQEVDRYILANSKRILNRVMIYDQGEPQKYQMHASYLQEVLGENAHVLSDFENLILEVSQIGDDATADTPCLNELTNALRSVRKNGEEEWDQLMRGES